MDMEVQKAFNNPVNENRNIEKTIDSSQVIDTLKTEWHRKGSLALSTAVYKHMCPELSKQDKDERTKTFLLEMGVNSSPEISPHTKYPHRRRWMRG